MSYLSGICKKEYKKKMVPIKGFPYELPEEEFGFDVGDRISVELDDSCHWSDDVDTHIYYVYVNHEPFTLTRKEVEDLVDIRFEYKTYNSCIKDGIPCGNLRGHEEGHTERTSQPVCFSCSIHWEVGRGMCANYHIAKSLT